MVEPKIMEDDSGNSVVMIPKVIFKNKQNINWSDVEEYLQKYVGKLVRITNTKDIIYLGKDFPDEYVGSSYTHRLKGANAKTKANAAQGICEMIEIAYEGGFSKNRKEKHTKDAKNGWYYYTTRFALPIYENESKTGEYNVYTACLVVNHASNGKKYLYDLVDIKKEASTPLKTNE